MTRGSRSLKFALHLVGVVLMVYSVPAEAATTVAAQPSTFGSRKAGNATSSCWLLMRSTALPGGPWAWVHLSKECDSVARDHHISDQSSLAGQNAGLLPVIHVGDELVIEQHSAVAEARLSGRALESAHEGAIFHARLRANGGLIRAVAIGPGRALLSSDLGERP